jgi:hypothetical protein
LPFIEWMTVRLDVSENDWRRHDKDMEPQRTGSVPPLDTRKRNRTLGRRKTTLGVGVHVQPVHVQPVGLNAEAKKDRHQPEGEVFLLTFPFIGLVRLALPAEPVDATPSSALIRQCLRGRTIYLAALGQNLTEAACRLD